MIDSSDSRTSHGTVNGPDGGPDVVVRTGRRLALAALRRGQSGVILESSLSVDDAALLRAMGVGVDSRVRLCRAGQPCIVAIGCACVNGMGEGKEGRGGAAPRWSGCRIGLARPLAERITVLVDD